MKTSSTILHLSDIQFGMNHRFTTPTKSKKSKTRTNRYLNEDDYQTLFSKLEADLKLLKKTENLVVNTLVISGDLAEWSTEDEYKHINIFIKSLIESNNTEIIKERIILVPGNHDINWDLCKAYFYKCKAHNKIPEVPYFEKFKFWSKFHRKFLTEENKSGVWQKYDLRSHGILVVGLNSCIKESHRTDDHFGFVGLPQIQEAMDWLNTVDPENKTIRIAVLHHNVFRGSDLDEENLKDWDNIVHILQENIDILLHGHRHESYRNILCTLSGDKIAVLASGSAGLDGESLPSCPNQYQILRTVDGDATLYLRRYAEEKYGKTGRGTFIPDTDEDGVWKYTFPVKSTTSEDIDLDRYLESSKRLMFHRLSTEQERVRKHIKLQCRNVRDDSISHQSLDLEFRSWLSDSSSQMILLGAAGSGKTVSCLNAASFCYNNIVTSNNVDWLPIYIELDKYVTYDNALDIIIEHFQSHGCLFNREQVCDLLRERQTVIFLDGFDEYDMGGAVGASDRSFEGFEHLCGPKTKVFITCRSNFFRNPEDIFLYNLRAHEFELCPENAVVVELKPLDSNVISEILEEFIEKSTIPDWLYNLADRPLFLRMIVSLVRNNALDLSQSIERHELYEKFICFVLQWDITSHWIPEINLNKSRAFHIIIAERFLEQGTSSLADVELFHLVRKVFEYTHTSNRFAKLVSYFQESGLLDFKRGRLVFSHKSFREYLIAKKIVDLIVVGDDSFDFIWFTRDEREFIVNMLTDSEKAILCNWLNDEEKYPACNYAAFILGGTDDQKMIQPLSERLKVTKDPLVKINCTNALAALGDESIGNMLAGAVSGYALDEGLLTMPPAGVDKDALKWASKLTKRFNRPIMLIHICESIDALAICGDKKALDIMRSLESASDKSIAGEAKAALRTLANRLEGTDGFIS